MGARDPEALRADILERWGRAAAGWAKHGQLMREFGMPVSAWMIEHADLQPGQRVLELAAGPGETGFLAAELIRPGGTLISTDATEEMLVVARARAQELGVRLAVEPTNPLRSDVSFVYTVRDAVDLARMAGIRVCVDFYSSWYERGLDDLVRRNIDIIELVQICDFKIGTLDTPNRVAIGDGDIPVERLLALVLDAGYEGVFELEILGPQIEAEGYRAPIVRSLERASEMLDRLGA